MTATENVAASSLSELEPDVLPCIIHTAGVHYSKEFVVGVVLAVSSSAFIGTSFIVKKKGLLR